MIKMSELVSIIIPVYNTEKYLERCLESVINQTYQNIEIICIDDGSNDDSIRILRHYKNIDNRIKIIQQENMGQSIARNNGIDIAEGKYLIFVDSDDYIDLEMVEKMISKIQDEDLDLVICGTNFIDSNNKIMKCDLKNEKELITKDMNGLSFFKTMISKGGLFSVSPCDKIYKIDIIRNNSVYFPDEKIHEDFLFNFRYLMYVQKIDIISKCLYNYNDTVENSTTNTLNRRKLEDILFVLDELKMLLSQKKEIELINSIEFKEYIFSWMSRATGLTKLGYLKKRYKYKDINDFVNYIKNNNEYKSLSCFILKNSRNKKFKLFIRILHFNNFIFLNLLCLNDLKNKIKKLKKVE